jgi:site-specific DNA-cytosine methylase
MDPFCTQILNKHWPDVPVYPDIRKLNGKEIGTVQIVCGGFPCQPFSQAGKRRGKDDDRDLWPQMFRIIRELRPHARWLVLENVAGFVNMELDRTVSDLESEGYEVRTFVLGAVCVQAPHQRQRCWIIAHSDTKRHTPKPRPGETGEAAHYGSSGTGTHTNKDVADSESLGHRGGNRKKRGAQQRELQPEEQEGSPVRGEAQGCGGSFPKDVADPISERGCGREAGGEDAENVSDRNDTGLQRGVQDRESYPEGRQESGNGSTAECGTGRQGNRNGHGSTQCGMGYLADGLSARLLDIGSIWNIEPDIPRVTTGEKNRVKKLKALGNSVVPQIPEIIGRLIMEVEREIQREGIHQDQE